MAKVTAEKIAKAKQVLAKDNKYTQVKAELNDIKKTEALMSETLDKLEGDIQVIKAEKKKALATKAQLEKKALEEGDTVTMKVEDIDKSGENGDNDGDNDDFNLDNFGDDGQEVSNPDEGAEDVVDTEKMRKEFQKKIIEAKNLERKIKLAEKKTEKKDEEKK